MDCVVHPVCFQCASEFVDQAFPSRPALVMQQGSTLLEAVEVFLQLEDPPLVKPQAFPHRITVLHGERATADMSRKLYCCRSSRFFAMRLNIFTPNKCLYAANKSHVTRVQGERATVDMYWKLRLEPHQRQQMATEKLLDQ